MRPMPPTVSDNVLNQKCAIYQLCTQALFSASHCWLVAWDLSRGSKRTTNYPLHIFVVYVRLRGLDEDLTFLNTTRQDQTSSQICQARDKEYRFFNRYIGYAPLSQSPFPQSLTPALSFLTKSHFFPLDRTVLLQTLHETLYGQSPSFPKIESRLAFIKTIKATNIVGCKASEEKKKRSIDYLRSKRTRLSICHFLAIWVAQLNVKWRKKRWTCISTSRASYIYINSCSPISLIIRTNLLLITIVPVYPVSVVYLICISLRWSSHAKQSIWPYRSQNWRSKRTQFYRETKNRRESEIKMEGNGLN